MLEIFLFVNPIGIECLSAERSTLKAIADYPDTVHYSFIPLVNLKIVKRYMELKHIPANDLTAQNKINQMAYSVALDFKAASFQGTKKAREFLLFIQSAINEHDRAYTPALVEEGLRAAGVDSAMFWDDRHSPYVQSGYEKDLAAATRMGVEIAPSMVLFDYAKDIDHAGLLVAGCTNENIIRGLFSHAGDLSATKTIQSRRHFHVL
ncbi:DsbA family protein [Schleiferilactobacillus shenzhenensis]|uniref:Uncharacterized protein n=1 Tax=Schleiferilactobacillus shenzhenensis LY-73 TaxID=1231336 RepID=U4TRS8_9LACO|nr:DsbA family protein [Schleiferilactobacillus shenzhenensis]ERL66160.1 hypothetical protein L248_1252 [Schleiferilactobacillus shenzhenensis LY-73]